MVTDQLVENNAVNQADQPPTSFGQITDDILASMWKPGRGYLLLLLATLSLAVTGGLCWLHQINTGLGVALVIFAGMWLERRLLVAPSLAAGPAILPGGAEALITLGFLASFLLAYLTVLFKIPILL